MIIEARNIHKYYNSLHVLCGIDIDLAKAEIISIVGASGAGKTTLLQILGTLESPDKGTVTFDGQNINNLSQKQLATFRNQQIGFIFQFHHLLPEFTTLENVCLPAMIGGKSFNEASEDAHKLLQYLGLQDRSNHKPTELSGGEQQRVAVARALINKPKVVFADEPSGNLDSNNAKELHNLFFKLRDDFGHSLVIVTHNEELAAMTDRKLHMADGKMIL
jgi:lipoprotein-releasing system ATP-binding protein